MRRIPASFQASDSLPDGRSVHFRPIRPADREGLLEAFHGLSKATVRDRFFSVKIELSDAELEFFTNVDLRDHVALVAELEQDGRQVPVAVGRFVGDQERPGHAEMAITVTDQHQGIGIGTLMLRQLIDCARRVEFSHLDATTFARNTRVAKLLRRSGLPLSSKVHGGICDLSLRL